MIIQMTNKVSEPKLNFWNIIIDIVEYYSFEIATPETEMKIVYEIEQSLKEQWTDIPLDNMISLDMESISYKPKLHISPILIKYMEDHYPEAMI